MEGFFYDTVAPNQPNSQTESGRIERFNEYLLLKFRHPLDHPFRREYDGACLMEYFYRTNADEKLEKPDFSN